MKRLLILLLLLAATIGAATLVGRSRGGTVPGDSYAFGSRDQIPRITLSRDQAPPDFSGGPITAADGETVTVYAQDAILAIDPSANQHWADFISGLLHGPELGQLTLFVATLDRVQQICGSSALGCYNRRSRAIVAVGQDQPRISARAVVTHEYGHHIANSRDNTPWRAVDWGTKRWASYLNVCKKAGTGDLVPGDEGRSYQLNPGEAFAEDYRVLNERRAGLPETAWQVVSQSLYPDQGALDALALDVTTPWAGNTTTTYASLVGPHATGRGFRLATPYDGHLMATLTSPAKARFAVRLVDLDTGSQISYPASSTRSRTFNVQLCGERSVQIQVRRISGSGQITLTVSKP